MNRTKTRISLIGLSALVATACAFGQTAALETFGSYRGDVTHIGFVDTAIGSNLALLWQFTRPSSHGNASSPVVTGKSVIYGLGKYVYAVSATTGSLIWQYPKAGDEVSNDFNCPPAYAAGKVYIGNDDGNLYAFDAANGSVIWKKTTSAFIHTAPVVVDGIVYFSSGTNLNAVDAATGKPTWTNPVQTQAGILTSPVVANGDVYVVDGTGTLYAASEISGRPLWNTQVSGSPVADGALVYDHNSLFFRDGRTLKVISGRGGDAKGEVDMGSEIIGPITVTDDGSYIVTTTNLKVTSLDNRGRKMWATAVDDFPSSPPLATRSKLFVTTNSGVIYELDRSTGAIKWTYTIQPVSQRPGTAPAQYAPIYTAPVVANQTLYILSDDGTLSAFRESAPDNMDPVVTALYPAPDSTISGKSVPYKIQVADIGSGVKPDSVSLQVDGKSIPVSYDVDRTLVHVQYQTGDLGMGLPVTLDALSDGKHTATLTCTDWRGNKLVHTWEFKVDKSRDALAASTNPVPVAGGSQYAGPQQTASASGSAPNVQTQPNQPLTAAGMQNNQGNVQQANVGGSNMTQASQGQNAQPQQPTQAQQPTQVQQPTPPAPVSVPVPTTGQPTQAPPTTNGAPGAAGSPPPPPPI